MLSLKKIFIIIIFVSMFIFPQSKYDNHVFFDYSKSDNFYFYSSGFFDGESKISLLNSKLPVESSNFFCPPNCIRMNWTSSENGNWKGIIKIDKWRNRNINFYGDYLSFWIFAPVEIEKNSLPLISIKDWQNKETNALKISQFINEIFYKKWTQIKIPIKAFSKTDKAFNFHKIKEINFSQGFPDKKEHTLLIDEITFVNLYNNSFNLPVPKLIKAKGYDRHIELEWEKINNPGLFAYKIYRSTNGVNFTPVAFQKDNFNRYSDFLGKSGVKVYYKVSCLDLNFNESPLSNSVSSETKKMSDEELLSMVQEASFRYYWDSGHKAAGLGLENIPGDENLIAVGASGFGIMAIITAAERGFITRDQAVQRLLMIVRFLKKADTFHGAFPHFLDGNTGNVIPLFGKHDNGGDLVETAFLMEGLLTARQYFNKNIADENEIRNSITEIWQRIEWNWYKQSSDSDFLFWHWSPDFEWVINHPLVGWNETMIVYLLAIASPTYPVEPEMFYSGFCGQSERAVKYRRNWGKTTDGDHYANGNNYYGIKLDVGVGSGGPLFFNHYSFMGFDPKIIKDEYTDYFENSKNITRINHLYCIDNPGGYAGYGDSCWGLTASDDPWGYLAHDPSANKDNGTITPTGALASFPFTPEESMKALKYFYRELGDKLWGIYGFYDAFNLTQNWFAKIYMGLNQAPITVMIENYRTGFIWKLFMSNPEIQQMVKRIGVK